MQNYMEALQDRHVLVLIIIALLLGYAIGKFGFGHETKAGKNQPGKSVEEALEQPYISSTTLDSTANEEPKPEVTGETWSRTRSQVVREDGREQSSKPPVFGFHDEVDGNTYAEAPDLLSGLQEFAVADNKESSPSIQTRTGENLSEVKLADPYAASEREWSNAETARAIALHNSEKQIMQIARIMHIDQKQVAIKLVRDLFSFEGTMEDLSNASRNGKSYTPDELAKMVSFYEAGVPIQNVAAVLERTVLGVGWRMIDRYIV